MAARDFSEVIEEIVAADGRYDKGAYLFVRRALDHTLKGRRDQSKSGGTHVSGQELLEGIREYALEQFGPMSKTLLEQWRVNECADFGEIVFNLVEHGVFGKTESDKREDFREGYSFEAAFVQPFRPRQRPSGPDLFPTSGDSEDPA